MADLNEKMYYIENDYLKVGVSNKGAEIKSIIDKKTGRECMWCADPKYWGRTAPVLFPIVGSVKNGKVIKDNDEYSISQHGFARDMIFGLTGVSNNELGFWLEDNDKTLIMYPYKFVLSINYKLTKNSIKIIYRINNCNYETAYYSIGAHPAFNCPFIGKNIEERSKHYLDFGKAQEIRYKLLDDNGLVIPDINIYKLDRGRMYITEELFAKGAMIVEKSGIKSIALRCDDDDMFINVAFTTDIFGLWAPSKEGTPFVCIEPWYGRADGCDFEGKLRDRKWNIKIDEKCEWTKSYTIEVG